MVSLIRYLHTPVDYRIEKILAEIKINLSHPLSIQALADNLNMSASRLQHLFKQEVGTSITKYIKNLRLDKARELLGTTYLSIKEIRVRVGLADKSHFFRDFRKEFGVSPSEYRGDSRK